MMLSNSLPSPTRLTQILTEMNLEGQFPMAILADRDGFPIASVSGNEQDPEKQSALVALVQRAVSHAQSQLGMAETDEFSVFDAQGTRLVCRPFVAGGQTMVLAIIVPDKNLPYRRLTTRAIRAIQQLWQGER